jgi:deoxycytidine triphosphate deaminase
MNTRLDDNTISELRKAECERLAKLPEFPHECPADENGVLLSDRIKLYCATFKFIDPFSEDLLKPAGYDLTVGQNYSVRGEQKALSDGLKLKIEPYQVAIIETFETLNIPKFLIGRWNIRVKLAYKGLLWVGGAQVDPGFRGHLCCPIYNLSTEAVTLDFREPLAMIDFVTTTPYKKGGCKTFAWADRKMMVFPEYPVLSSGIARRVEEFGTEIDNARRETATHLKDAEKTTEEKVQRIENRIDTLLTRIFTVVAMLFTALGIIATRASDQITVLNSPVWVAGIALWFALRATLKHPDPTKHRPRWTLPSVLALIITGFVVAASVFFSTYTGHTSAREVEHLKNQFSTATTTIQQETQARQTAIQELRTQSEEKIHTLQQQFDQLRQQRH